MLNGKKLLLTLVDTGGTLRARYVVLKGHAVRAEGHCAVGDLPADGALRIAFLSRSSYFDRVEVEAKSRKMLSFKARSQVDAALAFSEPFRMCFSASKLGPGRQQLSLVAVSEADFAVASAYLPLQSRVCERFVLVESAIAALVAQATKEAANVLWLRGEDLFGLLVENGVVLSRLVDRAAAMGGGEEALLERLERMRASLRSTARRVFPDREIALHLALGELAGKPNARGEGPVARHDIASSTLELRLAEAFTGVQPQAVLRWPEVFGLLTLDSDYSLLDRSYQERAWAKKFALGLGAALFVSGLVAGIATLTRYFN